MFSSSYSERKSKSGVRVVENDALRSQDETLVHTFKNKVSIRIGNEAVDGFLSFTSERVLFSREDDDKEETSWKAFQIYFKSVCVHAIESLVVHASPEEEKKEEKKVGEKCLYLQVEGELDPLIVRNAIERSDEDEEDDSFEEPATEVRIFPLMSDDEEGKEEEEEEEKPIVCASSPRQNLKSKRFRMKQEVSESKDFAGQEAKLLASIARLDEVVKRTNEINGGAFAKENELRRKEEEPKRAQPPQEEHALMRSIARLNLKLELTHETIQIHDEKLFRELLQIS